MRIPDKWVSLTSQALAEAKALDEKPGQDFFAGFSRTNGEWTLPNLVLAEINLPAGQFTMLQIEKQLDAVTIDTVKGLRSGADLRELEAGLPLDRIVLDPAAKRYYLKKIRFVEREPVSSHRVQDCIRSQRERTSLIPEVHCFS